MRISIAQISQTLGDIQGNVSRITDCIKKAKQKKCDMIVFPELSITGYCPLGLAVHPDFINQSYDAAEEVSGHCRGITAVAGFLEPCCPYNESAPFNTAATPPLTSIMSIEMVNTRPAFLCFGEPFE